MLEIPVIRFGKPYDSMSKEPVVHFETGETLAQMHQANGGLVKMDLRKAKNAREALRSIANTWPGWIRSASLILSRLALKISGH